MMKKFNSEYGLTSHIYSDTIMDKLNKLAKYPLRKDEIISFLKDNSIPYRVYHYNDLNPELLEDMHGKLAFTITDLLEVDADEELVNTVNYNMINSIKRYNYIEGEAVPEYDVIIANSKDISFQLSDLKVIINDDNNIFNTFKLIVQAQSKFINNHNSTIESELILEFEDLIKVDQSEIQDYLLNTTEGLNRDLNMSINHFTFSKSSIVDSDKQDEIDTFLRENNITDSEIRDLIYKSNEVRDDRIFSRILAVAKFEGVDYNRNITSTTGAAEFILIEVEPISIRLNLNIKQLKLIDIKDGNNPLFKGDILDINVCSDGIYD